MALNQFNATQSNQTVTSVSNANAIQQLLQNANVFNSYQQQQQQQQQQNIQSLFNTNTSAMRMNTNVNIVNTGMNQMMNNSNDAQSVNGLFNMKNINSYYSDRPEVSERIQEWKEMRGEGNLSAHVQIMKDNEMYGGMKQREEQYVGGGGGMSGNVGGGGGVNQALYSQQLQQLSKYPFPPINAVLEALSNQLIFCIF